MTGYIEHANMYVGNLDEAVRFLQAALPEFEVRGSGVHNGEKWLHVGTGASYLALYEDAAGPRARARKLNHIGFVVDDVRSTRHRLLGAGYREGFRADPHPYRRRLYFIDGDGLEWEFVEYLSDDPDERNAY